MLIKSIYLENFRNYEKQKIELSNNINVFYGNNAQGKTNILESLYFCALGRSFRTYKENELIKFGAENSKIKVEYLKNNRDLNNNSKKIIKLNKIKVNKNSELLGNLNLVLFSPDDIIILKQAPALRRKFLDILISQLKPNYIHLLSEYNKVLEQRNAYLKTKNTEAIDIWDEQLAEYSFKIYEYRKKYFEKISEKIENIHSLITKSGKENIKIKYISNSKDKNLRKTRSIDIKRGFTATGIHRDDFIIYINERPVSTFGSQGQQRTAILTLKLCELNIIKEEIGENPVLLLDDYMSELDKKRRKSFLENIEGNQVIITCTDKIDLKKENSIFYVENGMCIKQ